MRSLRPARAALLRWFDRHRRDLPWRRTRDPYAIWISEVMLQQTRVDTAIGYYARFLERFPTVGALASAPIADVLAHWAGLGYYRRARMLHAAAREIVAHHGGALPSDPQALRALPGIGRYTAGAVASIAFGVEEPVVDGNVERVLSRVLALRGDPRARGAAKTIHAAAAALVAGERPGDLNQSLMDLGATVCAPIAPRCADCPIAGECEARRLGETAAIPPPRERRAPVRVRQAAAVVRRGGRVLLVRRPAGGRMEGLYEFPTVEVADGAEPRALLASAVRDATGVDVVLGASVARVKHVITHHRIEVEAFEAESSAGRAGARARWLTDEGAAASGLTAAARKILGAVRARAL